MKGFETWGIEIEDGRMGIIRAEINKWKDIGYTARQLAGMLKRSEGRLNPDNSVAMMYQVVEFAKNCTPVAFCPWCKAQGVECSFCLGYGTVGPLMMDLAKEKAGQ